MARKRLTHSMDSIRLATPEEHWKQLRQGDRVSVRLAPGFESTGRVDAVTSDHSIVWVELDGGRGRTLVHCGDGVEIVRQDS